MAHDSRPIIADVACKNGDPYSTCQNKFERLVGISWEFDAPYEEGCNDRITIKNQLGYYGLVTRELDGKRGFIDLSAAPLNAGKMKVLTTSSAGGFRRARVVLWVEGERIDFESI